MRQAEVANTRSGDLISEEEYAAFKTSKQPEDGGHFPPMDPEAMTPIIEMIWDANQNFVARSIKVCMDVLQQQHTPNLA